MLCCKLVKAMAPFPLLLPSSLPPPIPEIDGKAGLATVEYVFWVWGLISFLIKPNLDVDAPLAKLVVLGVVVEGLPFTCTTVPLSGSG